MKYKYFFNETCLTCRGKVEFDAMTVHNCGWDAAYCKNCGTVYDLEPIIERAEKLSDIIQKYAENYRGDLDDIKPGTKAIEIVIPDLVENMKGEDTITIANEDYEFMEEIIEDGIYD